MKYGKYVRFPDERLWAELPPSLTECGEVQFSVSEVTILNDSHVREIRTPGPMSGERNRGQGGD